MSCLLNVWSDFQFPGDGWEASTSVKDMGGSSHIILLSTTFFAQDVNVIMIKDVLQMILVLDVLYWRLRGHPHPKTGSWAFFFSISSELKLVLNGTAVSLSIKVTSNLAATKCLLLHVEVNSMLFTCGDRWMTCVNVLKTMYRDTHPHSQWGQQ